MSLLLASIFVAHAELVVRVDEPKQLGQKTIIKLTMKNTFKESIESARAQVFLLDSQGKVVSQTVRWAIGGTKDKPPLAPDKEATFNFVLPNDKPFKTPKVSFSRVILQGGKLADVTKDVQIQTATP